MAQINQLSAITAANASGSDNFALYSSSDGDARKMSLTQVNQYVMDNFTSPAYNTTILVPISGFSLSLPDTAENQWALLKPAGALATGTVVLPVSTGLADGQEVMITTTAIISTFTLSGNGATVSGAPTVLAADDTFKMRYNAISTTWYKVV